MQFQFVLPIFDNRRVLSTPGETHMLHTSNKPFFEILSASQGMCLLQIALIPNHSMMITSLVFQVAAPRTANPNYATII